MYAYDLFKKFSQLAIISAALVMTACTGDDLVGPPPADTTTTTTTSVRIGSVATGSFVDGVLSLTPVSISSTGNTIVTVDLADAAGDPSPVSTTIDFTSTCVTGGMSTLSTTSVTTTTGIATTTYTAAGCAGSDLITATINGTTVAASASVQVASSLPSSIQFSTTSATLIALKGNGGSSGLPESADVTFLVLDNLGGPVVGQDVNFSLSTSLGGIALAFPSATSNGTGEVKAILQSGDFSTSVRVIATVASNAALTTPSNAISIATGPPEQNGISLSASELNPRAWNNDGTQVSITASLTDKFQNPIADGTAILFTTELGGIQPSCTTVGGNCSVNWSSKDPRANMLAAPGIPGITTILARVVGEEHFNDSDGNGVFSLGDTFTDLPEAFRDDNNNTFFDAFEFFDDINNNNAYDGGNGLYNGIGCTHPTLCDLTSDTITVRDSIQLVMAEDNATIFQVQYNNSGVVPLGTTFDTTIDSSITYTIGGSANGNVLPVGTTIKFATTNGEIIGGEDQVVGNTVSTANSYTVFVGPDTTPSNGFLTIEVDTGDGGGVQSFTPIPISDGTVNNTRIGSFISTVFTEGVVSLSSNTIAPLGTSSVTVDLVDLAAAPISTSASVSFTSPCIAGNLATLNSSTVITSSGQAVVTYTDAGCTGLDVITATLNGTGRTATGTITISSTPSPAGSINQSGISNSTIALAGTGSASGLPETSTLTFLIKDANDNPVQGEAVSFSLNSTVGGINLSSASAISDASGEVTTIVQSGTVATSVRVTATVDSNTALTTASSAIAIATGPPDQNSMSIAAVTLNPRAWNFDGRLVDITAFVGDRFNNPITDGTAISFTTEFGSVSPSCVTTNGSCVVQWRSQSPRTNALGGTPGVTTIMATVEGEESFSDVDGDGVFSDGDSFTDLPEAFRDDNNTLGYDAGELFVDFIVNGIHDPVNGLYNGKGCVHLTLCDTVRDAITVRDSLQIVLAEDTPAIAQVRFDSTIVPYPIGTPDFDTDLYTSISVTIGGASNNQVLPEGSTIGFATDNGSIVAGGSHTVPSSNSGAGTYTVFVTDDGTPSNDGFLTIDVNIGDGGAPFSFTPIAINDIGATYSIGGTVSGLPGGESVTLQNNAGNNLPVTANGAFVFTSEIPDGADYEVTVGLDPATATCSVALETGTVNGADVTDVVVTCL